MTSISTAPTPVLHAASSDRAFLRAVGIRIRWWEGQLIREKRSIQESPISIRETFLVSSLLLSVIGVCFGIYWLAWMGTMGVIGFFK